MMLKVKVNDLHFQYQLRVSHDACLMQISWFHRCCRINVDERKVSDNLKFVTIFHAEFTDRQTDGRTDAGNDNTPSAFQAKG